MSKNNFVCIHFLCFTSETFSLKRFLFFFKQSWGLLSWLTGLVTADGWTSPLFFFRRNTRWICSTRFATWCWSWWTCGGSCCQVTWRRTRAETWRGTSPSGWTGATSEKTWRHKVTAGNTTPRHLLLMVLVRLRADRKGCEDVVDRTLESGRGFCSSDGTEDGWRFGWTPLIEAEKICP